MRPRQRLASPWPAEQIARLAGFGISACLYSSETAALLFAVLQEREAVEHGDRGCHAPAVSSARDCHHNGARVGPVRRFRRKLLQECEVHTLLRLPTGIFYAQGVKANVIFFDRKPGAKEPWTKKVWIYDCRTNKEFTLKERRMVRADLDDFVKCYHPENRHQRKPTWNEKRNPEGRWRGFTYEEIAARDKCSLDIFWLKDESLEDSSHATGPTHSGG